MRNPYATSRIRQVFQLATGCLTFDLVSEHFYELLILKEKQHGQAKYVLLLRGSLLTAHRIESALTKLHRFARDL